MVCEKARYSILITNRAPRFVRDRPGDGRVGRVGGLRRQYGSQTPAATGRGHRAAGYDCCAYNPFRPLQPVFQIRTLTVVAFDIMITLRRSRRTPWASPRPLRPVRVHSRRDTVCTGVLHWQWLRVLRAAPCMIHHICTVGILQEGFQITSLGSSCSTRSMHNSRRACLKPWFMSR